MEKITFEAETLAEYEALAALLRSVDIPLNPAEPPIRRGDRTATNRGLPPLWADRPDDLAQILRREAWKRE